MKYFELIDAYKEDMIENLSCLVSIPSVESGPFTLPDGSIAPFGENIHKALVYMLKMAEEYPDYDFEIHKGYGTKEHTDLIKQYGPSDIHRLSFLKNILK